MVKSHYARSGQLHRAGGRDDLDCDNGPDFGPSWILLCSAFFTEGSVSARRRGTEATIQRERRLCKLVYSTKRFVGNNNVNYDICVGASHMAEGLGFKIERNGTEQNRTNDKDLRPSCM